MTDEKLKKERRIAGELHNSWTRHTVKNINKKRRAMAKLEERKEELVLELLELQYSREIVSIQVSQKNQRQSNGWVI